MDKDGDGTIDEYISKADGQGVLLTNPRFARIVECPMTPAQNLDTDRLRSGAASYGRDHNAKAMTIWFAGGGVDAGHTVVTLNFDKSNQSKGEQLVTRIGDLAASLGSG